MPQTGLNADSMSAEIKIRECVTIVDFEQCLSLQRDVFKFPDIEISPRRHFIVSRRAGGWVLGAFVGDELIGFVHQIIGVQENQVYGYSHMLAVKPQYQNSGIGGRLKWAQQERTLVEGRNLIRWTWDPMQARNAHFNLNRLGVVVRSYAPNFYGTDYSVPKANDQSAPRIDSDRLFAEWEIDSERVNKIKQGKKASATRDPSTTITIPPNWSDLVKTDPATARNEQVRVRSEFELAFAQRMICSGFERNEMHPRYLLYTDG